MFDMTKLVNLYSVAIADMRRVPEGNIGETTLAEAAMLSAEAAVLAAGAAEAAMLKASVAEAIALAHRVAE